MVNEENIDLLKIRIERFAELHLKHVIHFESFDSDLTAFLQEDAWRNQKRNISVTHLWFYKEQLVGYITLLADALNLSAELQQKFQKQGIKYKSLPAIKIARLCVASRFIRKGIGTHMIDFTIQLVLKLNEHIGCRFITVDAKTSEDSKKDPVIFYKKFGFQVMKSNRTNSIPMYIDCEKFIVELRQMSSNFSANEPK
ncbi:MAG: GNAT family N-acetyltransferase [Candidatus Diapherotrites archaeon]|nr:GNAT family N-acetyltransferase [Candidatus Diapherotrites archaeon]